MEQPESSLDPQTDSDTDEESFDELRAPPPVLMVERADSVSVRRIMRIQTAVVLLLVLALIVETVLRFTSYKTSITVVQDKDTNKSISFVETFSLSSAIVGVAWSTTFFALELLLLIIFVTRLVKNGWRKLREEQILVVALVALSAFYLLPVDEWEVYRATRIEDTDKQIEAILDTTTSKAIASAVSAPLILVYIWSFMDIFANFRRGAWLSYAQKGIVYAILATFKIVLAVNGIGFHAVPVVSIAVLVRIASQTPVPDWTIALSVLNVVAELGFVAWLVFLTSETRDRLDKKDYLKTRTTQLAFRFFAYCVGAFVTVAVLSVCYAEFVLADDTHLLQFRLVGFLQLSQTASFVDDGLLLFYFTLTQVFVNLPADTGHFPFWYRKISLEDEPKRMRFLVREAHESPVHSMDRDFCVETCVLALNFSWWTYWYDSDERERPSQVTDYTEYVYHDEEHDTHALILVSSKRIVVAFRGTKSRQNIRTDLKASSLPQQEFRESLRRTTPEDVAHSHFDLLHRTQDLMSFIAKVHLHKGFAMALAPVYLRMLSKLKTEFARQERPILVTGHSLGGALASLFAVNLLLDFPTARNAVTVYTFASPRVGNVHFKGLSRQLLYRSFRVYVRGDPIAQIPKWPFRQVETGVFLTNSGELFLDPTGLETLSFRRTKTKFSRHMLGSYATAIRVWARSYPEIRYTPYFWPYFEDRIDSRTLEDFNAQPGPQEGGE